MITHTHTCTKGGERKRERYRDVRCPKGQIVPEKLHDQCTILVRFLTQSIQLRNSLIKSLPNEKQVILVDKQPLDNQFMSSRRHCGSSHQNNLIFMPLIHRIKLINISKMDINLQHYQTSYG